MHALARAAVPILALACVLTPTAAAQKITSRNHVDEQHGYRFRPPARWDIIPVQPNLTELGLLARIESDERALDLFVLRSFVDEEGERRGFVELFDELYGDVSDDLEELEDEEVKVGKIVARHRRVEAADFGGLAAVLDAWTFSLPDYDVELVFTIPVEHKKLKRWLQTFKRSAKTFSLIERDEAVGISKHSSYEDILAYHAEDASRTPGWRALPTPSKKFVIKTSSDNDRFLKEVIERLELSRELYERDFPPEVEMNHVSVVRVCGTREEFHRYGMTGGGVAGWFNPGTKELVLYDAKNINRNSTYAVMSHEAFHQYCHFLFDESEAHRWFDEGHGDYYGGAEFKRGRAKITPHMPAGLDRLGVIRQMVTESTYAPIERHLNYSHQEWQTQGPSNVSCYAQSWSIVYFLREGSLGNVSRKVWKEEYAKIIPAYVETLFGGFKEAYRELREKQMKKAERKSKGESIVLDDERPEIDEERKQEIWEAAIEAAWGGVDLSQFEKDWLLYVKKYLE